MSDGVELATAWVRLVPTMEGATDTIVKAFVPGQKAAEKEGERAGRGWSSKVKGAIGAAAIGAGIVGSFVGLYKVGEIFDDVTDTIRVGTGLQGDALDGLVDIAKNVGTKVPAEFDKIGPVVADLNTRLGLSGDTLETVSSQYLEASRILGEDVDVKKTSAAFSAFKIEGDGVSTAMDTLFQVSQATGVGMNDLAAGVQRNAPALQALGFGFEESVAMLGSFDKAGLNTQQITAAMSKGLVTLAKDGEEPQEAFARVSSEIQGFIDKGDKAGALDLASQVFGTRGATQFIGALESGVLGMDDLMAATGATGDTILGVGEETMDFAERWQMTLNTALVAIEPLATAVFTALGDGLAFAMPGLQALGAWIGDNTAAIGIVAGIIGVTLVAAFVAWTASIWAATAAMLANPITWIIIGLVALIAAVVALVMNWDAVVAWITDIWSGFISWTTGVINGFVGWWNRIWAAVGTFITNTWNGFIGGVKSVFSGFLSWAIGLGSRIISWWNGLWSGIGQFVSDLWQNGIVAPIKSAFESVYSGLRNVGSNLNRWWNDLWSGIGDFFSGIWDGIVNAVVKFGGFFRDAFGGIKGFVRTAFSGVLGVVKGPLNGIIGVINSAVRALNGISVTIPDWVPIVGGQTWGLSLPTIPMLADGGTITRSGAVIVGENGPELLRLPAGASVDPDITNSGPGGPAVVIKGNVTTLDVGEFVRAIDRSRRAAYWQSGALVTAG